MATARRVFWESVLFIAFLVILAGVLLWSEGRVSRHTQELTARQQAELEAASQRHRDEIRTLDETRGRLSEEQAKRQARAVFSAFEAGIHTAAAARWGRYLDNAKDELVAQPEVLFVHVVSPQGRLITTSSEELAQAGSLDESGDWALSADGMISRNGQTPGAFEVAGPILDEGRRVAVLWIGYDLTAVGAASGSGP